MIYDELWEDIPIGRDNAIEYPFLCLLWGCNRREARAILHELSLLDNGDDYILIRSSRNRGFYRTDDMKEIEAFRAEIESKAKSSFVPLKKINRIMRDKFSAPQFELINNLKQARITAGFKQTEAVERLSEHFPYLDVPLLSKMECGVCAPNADLLIAMADLYGVKGEELFRSEIFS